jgi:hypothetical protein
MTSGGQMTSSTSRSDVIWNVGYTIINTANGVIENAQEVGLDAALVAEANFFRAFHYFSLVQTFGGVPLDLGSGELKFNTTPSRVSVRNTVPEVYTKAIFPDLKYAVDNLPDSPRQTGTVAKTVALLYLAKAYLTYGWWLQNPNNIPTYPECARTDPDGHDANWYFQQAYNVAVEGIENAGTSYGLLDYFYDVHLGSNDRNKEILLYTDHTENSEFYNGASLTYGGGGAPGNFAGWMVTCQTENIRSATDAAGSNWVSSVIRTDAQDIGRPWTRMATPIGVFTNTFANKTEDSRYDGTFVSVYRANFNVYSIPGLYNANFMPVYPDDAILSFLPEDLATHADYSNAIYKSNVAAGVVPGRADYVMEPSFINRQYYPGNWKLGPYRTNTTGIGQPNAESTRPFNIAKFSELYLIAAEAAVKGATPVADKSARDLVNVLRARAGKWRWDHAGNVAKNEDHSAAMIAATPATITIDYILEERSREFFGEGYRWFDLVRTQKWDEIAGSYQICEGNAANRTPQTFIRTIEPHHYLRPIPQTQIDGMEMTAEEKIAYQNPGY